MPRRARSIPPIEKFPLRPRADGRFQKRIRGKLYYFGFGGNRESAIHHYDRVKADLYAGRDPRQGPEQTSGITVKSLADEWLLNMWANVKAGQFLEAGYNQHKRAVERLVAFLGPGRSVISLGPPDFSAYARHLAPLNFAGATFNRERTSILVMFNWAVSHGRIKQKPMMGSAFRRIPKGTIREKRRFSLIAPAALAELLKAARPQIRAMIYLGINAGMGAEDCAKLRWDAIAAVRANGRHRILSDRRAKTGIVQEAPLWPETVTALAALRRKTPEDGYIFHTKYGNRWSTMSVAHEFQKLVKRVNAGRTRPLVHTFYDLRRTFVTTANATKDRDAVLRIAGRKLADVDDTYLQALAMDRLLAVVNHVRIHALNISSSVSSQNAAGSPVGRVTGG